MIREPDSGRRLGLIVDGGGTKTACRVVSLVGDQWQSIAVAKSTGSNPAEIGVDAAVVAIHTAVRQAAKRAALDSSAGLEFERAAFSIAGTVDEPLRQRLQDELTAKIPVQQCRVFPDILPPVLVASDAGPAVAVIGGTGSVAVARTSDGAYTTIGGWGYLLGDEGSGYDIGRAATSLALTQLEAGESLSPLASAVMAALDVRTKGELKKLVYRVESPRRTIAAVARTVLKAGTDDAETIVRQAAVKLADLTRRAAETVGQPWATLPIAAAGGLFAGDGPLRSAYKQAVQQAGHTGSVRFVGDPLDACLHLLRDEVFHTPFSVDR